MKTIYIYLFRNNYTQDHINHMGVMISYMEIAKELFNSVDTERTDLNAWEVKTQASPQAVKFLEHMSECDMLFMTYEPIVAD